MKRTEIEIKLERRQKVLGVWHFYYAGERLTSSYQTIKLKVDSENLAPDINKLFDWSEIKKIKITNFKK